MQMILAVGAGGALGAILRFFMVGAMTRALGAAFPWGTLAVNVLGSFVMGVLAAIFMLRFPSLQQAQAFLLTGVLGGFTTFSAFSFDAVRLIEREQIGAALIYIGGSVILSLVALAAGLLIPRSLMSGL